VLPWTVYRCTLCCVSYYMALLRVGESNRHVGSTSANEQSSRSHTIFTLSIESSDSMDVVPASEQSGETWAGAYTRPLFSST